MWSLQQDRTEVRGMGALDEPDYIVNEVDPLTALVTIVVEPQPVEGPLIHGARDWLRIALRSRLSPDIHVRLARIGLVGDFAVIELAIVQRETEEAPAGQGGPAIGSRLDLRTKE